MAKKERKNLYGQIAISLNNGKNKQAYDLVANMASEEGLFILTEYKGDGAAPALLEALEELLSRYTGLINSGDAGYWNPEEEDEVIKARAAIAAARGTV